MNEINYKNSPFAALNHYHHFMSRQKFSENPRQFESNWKNSFLSNNLSPQVASRKLIYEIFQY